MRATLIKEQRSTLVKEHLWVLWTDYFKPPHFEKYPNLHTLFNEATKLAGAAGTKDTWDVAKGDALLAKIDEMFAEHLLGDQEGVRRAACGRVLEGRVCDVPAAQGLLSTAGQGCPQAVGRGRKQPSDGTSSGSR